jgi:hypothetical protein
MHLYVKNKAGVFMKEKDLLEFLMFIAEEDAQISTIISFFSSQLGYDVNLLKSIIYYGVKMDILQVIENIDCDKYEFVKVNELNEIDWSISNVGHEIFFNDFEYYRKQLFVDNPKIPNEFICFIND